MKIDQTTPAATLIALFTFVALAATAAEPQATAVVKPPVNDTGANRASKLSLADLDLSTPEGVRMANARVHALAHLQCEQLEDMSDLSRYANYSKCVDAAMAAAVPKIAQLAKSSGTKPAVVKN